MLEIINFPKRRFKSIHLNYMKPQLTCLLFLISVHAFGQLRGNRSEVGMGYGSYSNLSKHQSTPHIINSRIENPIDFNAYTEGTWYNTVQQIRNYDIHALKRIKQSKNLRRSLFVGAKISGQFQHRTLFIGTIEKLEEETVIDKKTGEAKRAYSFQTDAFAEINDYINVSPKAFYRIILNDFLSVNASITSGVLIPIRTGIQKSSFTGSVSRHVEGETVLSEYKTYDGELSFDWFNTKYRPKFRFESSVSVELKPSAKKPYYVSFGLLAGQHINTTPL